MKAIDFIIKQHPIWITFGYLGLLAGVFYKYTLAGQSLSLNELGDFLAGAFAPLAFYWLVLGFFQQGKELRNSVEALNNQAQELARSAQEQKNLTESSKNTIDQQNRIVTQKLWQETTRLAHETEQMLKVASYSFGRIESRFTPDTSQSYPPLAFGSVMGNPTGVFGQRQPKGSLEDLKDHARQLGRATKVALASIVETKLSIPPVSQTISLDTVSTIYSLNATARELKQQSLLMNEEFVQLIETAKM